MTPTLSNLVPVQGWNGKFFTGPNHTYWWRDKKGMHPLSGVTSVLNVIAKPALIPWAARVAVEHIEKTIKIENGILKEDWVRVCTEAKQAYQQKTDYAAGLGTDAHFQVEDYIKECLRTNNGAPIVYIGAEHRVREFSEWAIKRHSETGFTFISSETAMADPKFAIAGTPDFIGEETVDGLWTLIIGDLKTGSGIYDRTYFFQMAAYAYMWMKWKKRMAVPKMVIIHCPSQKPNQPLAEYWSDDWKGDWEAFKAALVLHRTKNNFIKPNKKP